MPPPVLSPKAAAAKAADDDDADFQANSEEDVVRRIFFSYTVTRDESNHVHSVLHFAALHGWTQRELDLSDRCSNVM